MITKPIKVIDAVMGAGKTTEMFKKIATGEILFPILYISPFLSEVGGDYINTEGVSKKDHHKVKSKIQGGRIQNEVPTGNFKYPKDDTEFTSNKSEHLEYLVDKCHNISCTHELMQKMTPATFVCLKEHGYTIIIDEAINSFEDFRLKRSDLESLVGMNHLTIDGRSQCHRHPDSDYNGVHNHIVRACDNGAVYATNSDQVLIWEFPTKLFELGADVWVMTYPFEGTYMKSHFEINSLPYEIVSNESMGIASEKEIIQKAAQLLEIYDGKSNAIGNKQEALSFSSLTLGRGTKAVQGQLSTAMRNVATNVWKADSGSVLWTVYGDAQKGCTPRGYAKRFIPFNKRATNDYADVTHIMYGINRYPRTTLINHISSRGGSFDRDQYALGEMLQLLWRGCIRKGEPMKVFIPSRRMRDLLYSWLSKYEEIAIAA